MPAKHEELSEQLTSWWRTQTAFKTKKALASFLNVHPDTLGDYFSGRKFPRSDIADRLSELTNITCLRYEAGSRSSAVAVSTEGLREPIADRSMGHLQEKSHPEKSPEVITEQPPMGLPTKGGRYEERSVVISLQRTKCPFCAHDIVRFSSCTYCGQHFVRANIPLENSELTTRGVTPSRLIPDSSQ
jgi:hypothetical protein